MDKKELGKNLVKSIEEADKLKNLEEMIKRGEIVFPLRAKVYRIRKPTYEEQLELESFRRKKYLEFIKDPTMLKRDEWIKVYKENGKADIEAMENEILQLDIKKEDLQKRLATSTNESEIKKLEKEIREIELKKMDINMEKTDLLSYSIEDQLMIAANSYYTYLVLEIKKDDKWGRVFIDYKGFCTSTDNVLINKAFYYLNCLIYSPII